MLPERQRDVLVFIAEFQAKEGYSPSIRDIGGALGILSTNAVTGHLAALEKKGLIQRSKARSRCLVLTPAAEAELSGAADGLASVGDNPPAATASYSAVPVVGTIAAGTPILAKQNIDYHISVDPMFLPRGVRPELLFALRVQGDSMVGASIFHGDIIVAKIQEEADNGAIVVARIDDSATVKRFYREAGGFRLVAENPRYAPMVFRGPEANKGAIQGVVLSVIHRLS